jgi:hypothetical protein
MLLRRALLTGLISLPAISRAFADEPCCEPCCGPITSAGMRLAALLDSMDVEHRWLPQRHVDWQTGLADQPADFRGPDTATHCSAFAAAVGWRLGVYLLRPPEFRLTFLASAQSRWLSLAAAQSAGWRRVESWMAAQSLANQGQFVVICYENPNPKRSGHIVVVRPSLKSAAALALEGPQVIQAATRNRSDWPAAKSFTAHPGAWPNEVKIFAHEVAALAD